MYDEFSGLLAVVVRLLVVVVVVYYLAVINNKLKVIRDILRKQLPKP